MKISKKDALMWFEFFAGLDGEEELLTRQTEIVYATLYQIEAAVDSRRSAMLKAIPGLKSLNGRTYYVGGDDRFPAGCRSCLMGTGLSAVRKTNRCNIRCRFCYNYGEMDDIPPIGEGLWEIGGTRLYEEDIGMALDIQQKPTGVAYVYLEPFMEIEAYYGVIRRFHAAGVHQHLYTNGLLADEESLRALGECGLDELRFNLGASDCAEKVVRNMAVAKKYIPQVGVETPMTPSFYRAFHESKDKILATGIDFINCAELHLNPNNILNYEGENMYACRLGYISPIFSRDLTLTLMREAGEERWPVTVHDCANRTKLMRGLNLKAKEGGCFGESGYGMEFDRVPVWAFLPVLRDESFSFLEEEPLPEEYRPGRLY